MDEQFGERLRRLREAKGLTQRTLSQAVTGSDRSAFVSDWERGVVVPSPDHFFRLSEALGVNPQYLYMGAEPATPKHSRIVDLAFEIQARIADLARDEKLALQHREIVLRELLEILREPVEPDSGSAPPPES